MSVSEIKTSKPIMEWDDDLDENITDEEEDPLFGKFENNPALGLLLSPKKKKKQELTIQNALSTSPLRKRGLTAQEKSSASSLHSEKKKINSKTVDILQQLQSRMKNPLDKELGFSINKTAINSFNTDDFKDMLSEKKRDETINKIIVEENQLLEISENNEKEIEQWVVDHVCSDFLNIKNEKTNVHSRWIHNLKNDMRKIIQNNNNTYDEHVLENGLSKLNKYYHFKCFNSKGISGTNDQKTLAIYEAHTVESLLRSFSVQYVENFKMEPHINLDTGYEDLLFILKSLGFDANLITSDHPIEKKFDEKNSLPIGGCGLQVFKFVQLLNVKELDQSFDTRDVLSSLVLMSLDYSVCKESRRFFYKGKLRSITEILMNKINEFKLNASLINHILKNLFGVKQKRLWFQFINKMNTSSDVDLLLKGKISMEFLSNDDADNIDFAEFHNFESLGTTTEIFEYICSYIKKLSYTQLKTDNENYPEYIYMKTELLKDAIICNETVIEQWRLLDFKKYDDIKRSVLRLKNNYFKNFENSLNSDIPKTKRILDFIFHEISGMDVGDFFTDNIEG